MWLLAVQGLLSAMLTCRRCHPPGLQDLCRFAGRWKSDSRHHGHGVRGRRISGAHVSISASSCVVCRPWPTTHAPLRPCRADVCLNGPAKQARQLALMLRDHPAGLSTRHMLTGGLQGEGP